MKKIVILAIDAFDYMESKTGNMLLRYSPEDVIAIIDPSKTGKTAQSVIGYGGDIPVISTFQDSLKFNPDSLVIGNAPQGGRINKAYRSEINDAIRANCDIYSGMHTFLNDDEAFKNLSIENDISLFDLRKPSETRHFPKGLWQERKVPVMLIVGTDCDTGKMTTAWEIKLRLESSGKKVAFLGTGQTGILLSGNGVPIDAVVSDFMAGEIEHCIEEISSGMDLVIIEGQGAISNYAYSGVTLGLLHGAMPDFMIMTHNPGRKHDVLNYPLPDIESMIKLHLDLMKPFKLSRFLGINLLTHLLDEASATSLIQEYTQTYHLPVTDLVRFGSGDLINHIEEALEQWN